MNAGPVIVITFEHKLFPRQVSLNGRLFVLDKTKSSPYFSNKNQLLTRVPVIFRTGPKVIGNFLTYEPERLEEIKDIASPGKFQQRIMCPRDDSIPSPVSINCRLLYKLR